MRWGILHEAATPFHDLAPLGFAPLCPDLVVEMDSPSDEGPRGLTALRQKMAAYQANGARLGWLQLLLAEIWAG